jgi:integrase
MGSNAPEYKLGKLKGRYVVRWREGDKHPRYRLSAATKEEAEQQLAVFVRQRTMLLAREAKTIGELFDAYLRDREVDGKPTAKHDFSWRALRATFGHLSPTDVDKFVCVGYHKARVKLGRSPGTTRTELVVLQSCLNWARKSKLIAAAPHVWLPAAPPPKDRHLTKDEGALLIQQCARTSHLRVFVILALGTAGRRSALLELQWSRVDFERGQIDLRAAEQNRIKRRAIVAMNATVRAALLEAREGALTDYVIEWAVQPVKSIKTAFNKAVERCGLDDVTPHTLRHTAAVWMAEAGESMSVIAQYLGHADSRITERIYARYSPTYLKKASAALEMPLRSVRGKRKD